MTELHDRLRTLVDYWIDHNQEHADEMRQWADKAAPLGPQVAEALQMAATNLTEATACLERAKDALH
jgi:hypothetical protein